MPRKPHDAADDRDPSLPDQPAAEKPSATETECSPCIGTGRAGGGYYHGAHEHGAAGDEVCGPCGGSGVTQAVRA